MGLSAYVCVLAGNDCGIASSDTLGISLIPVGIRNISCSDIIIFPNPSDGVFYLSFGKCTDEIELTVLNSGGKVVLQKKLQSILMNTYNLDLYSNPSGIYFLKFVINNTIEYRRIILK